MDSRRFLLPELIDTVFEYLDDHDLYHCIQVNREFNAHGIRFLYRSVELYFQPYRSRSTRATKQNAVWSQFCCYPELLSYIRQLTIHVLSEVSVRCPIETAPRFENRVEYILRQGRNIRTFNVFDLYEASGDEVGREGQVAILNARVIRLAQHIFSVLQDLQGYREITLQGDQELLFRLEDKSQVVSLSTTGFRSPSQYLLLQHYSKLRRLNLYDHIDASDFDIVDFERIFENAPLKYLQIDVTDIYSLPRTVQQLRIGSSRQGCHLTQKTWQAVSRLPHLTELYAGYERILEEWVPFAFESPNLLCLYLEFASSGNRNQFRQQILQPILAGSKSLSSVRLSSHLLSGSTLQSFSNSTSTKSITQLCLVSKHTKFSFEDLVVSLDGLPRLEKLVLPFPLIMPCYPSGDAEVNLDVDLIPVTGTPSTGSNRPVILHFSHCEAIAASCPNLDKIRFYVDENVTLVSGEDYDLFLAEEHTDADEAMLPCDPENFDPSHDQFWFTVKRSQLYKNRHFVPIDDAPCLHFCTTYYDTCDKDLALGREFYLLLGHVRKHAGFQ